MGLFAKGRRVRPATDNGDLPPEAPALDASALEPMLERLEQSLREFSDAELDSAARTCALLEGLETSLQRDAATPPEETAPMAEVERLNEEQLNVAYNLRDLVHASVSMITHSRDLLREQSASMTTQSQTLGDMLDTTRQQHQEAALQRALLDRICVRLTEGERPTAVRAVQEATQRLATQGESAQRRQMQTLNAMAHMADALGKQTDVLELSKMQLARKSEHVDRMLTELLEMTDEQSAEQLAALGRIAGHVRLALYVLVPAGIVVAVASIIGLFI